MLRVGRSLRALRLRRRLRQADVAVAAGLSRSQAARIERGELSGIPVGDVVAHANALGADVGLRVRWHGEALDRLLDADHAELVDQVLARLRRFGWDCTAEASFSVFGERGSIDILAFHASTGVLLVVEVKSVVPDAQATLAAHDRKARLARTVAAERGWHAKRVARLLVIGESTTSRRRVGALASTFSTAYPDRGRAVRQWLRSPAGPMSALLFLPYGQRTATGCAIAGRQRVRRPGPRRNPAN